MDRTRPPRSAHGKPRLITAARPASFARARLRQTARYLPSTTGMGALSASSRFPSHT